MESNVRYVIEFVPREGKELLYFTEDTGMLTRDPEKAFGFRTYEGAKDTAWGFCKEHDELMGVAIYMVMTLIEQVD